MRAEPWQVVDLLTGETLGWYPNSDIAWFTHRGEPIDVIYRPGRKGKAKK